MKKLTKLTQKRLARNIINLIYIKTNEESKEAKPIENSNS